MHNLMVQNLMVFPFCTYCSVLRKVSKNTEAASYLDTFNINSSGINNSQRSAAVSGGGAVGLCWTCLTPCPQINYSKVRLLKPQIRIDNNYYFKLNNDSNIHRIASCLTVCLQSKSTKFLLLLNALDRLNCQKCLRPSQQASAERALHLSTSNIFRFLGPNDFFFFFLHEVW